MGSLHPKFGGADVIYAVDDPMHGPNNPIRGVIASMRGMIKVKFAVCKSTRVRPDLSGALFIVVAERSRRYRYKKAGTEGGNVRPKKY
ncbi:MAG: hypothetical protein ACOH1X_05130 [Kaistella sp.]